jgi:hypothetical protein
VKVVLMHEGHIHQAFLEHCKKREVVPQEIVEEYFRILEGVMR